MLKTSNGLYSSRLIRASALPADTKALLSNWDLNLNPAENLERVQLANIFGKSSRARVKAILIAFRQRYFDDPEVGRALVTLSQSGVPGQLIDPLLYFHSVQNDLVMRDIVLEVLYPRLSAGFTDITVERVSHKLQEWSAAGRTTSPWGEGTTRRLAQGVLASLRDFGVLSGKVRKSITPIYLPTESFAFIAFELWRKLASGDRVLNSDEWKLFFLPVEGVERFFLEAHQDRFLTYNAAGSVIRIEFPAQTLEEYASVLVSRARETA